MRVNVRSPIPDGDDDGLGALYLAMVIKTFAVIKPTISDQYQATTPPSPNWHA
ncbi:MAG: hypothetical protein ACYCZJ_05740 [Sulfuriferula sp.]